MCIPHCDFLLSAGFGRMGPLISLPDFETAVVVGSSLTFGKSPHLSRESGHSVLEKPNKLS